MPSNQNPVFVDATMNGDGTSVHPLGLKSSLQTPTNAIYAANFGAKFDGKAFFSNVNTCSFAIGTNVFTCTGANLCDNITVPCSAGQSSDVGKQFIATIGSCCGVSFNFQGTLAFAKAATTITSVISPTSARISQNFTANSGANWIIAWATNDDAALSLAETAWQSGNKCQTIILPAGITAVLKGHFNNPGANCLGMEPQADFTAAILGQGKGSTIIGLFPGFDPTTCTGGAGLDVCFGGYFESVFQNLQWNGFGWGNTTFAVAKKILGPGLGSEWTQVGCNAFGGSDTNVFGFSFDGLGVRVWGLSIDGCGNVGGLVNSNIAKAYYSFFGDNLGPALQIQTSADLTDFGSDFGSQGGTIILDVRGTFRGYGSNLFSCSIVANATAIYQGNASGTQLVDLIGAKFNCLSATSNGYFGCATCTLKLSGGTIIGGTTSAINRNGAIVFIDTDTNIIAGLVTGTGQVIADGHSLSGICTGVATAGSTLGLYGTGANVTVSTCTSATIGLGTPISGTRTALGLSVSATAGGVNASSGVVTVLKNGVGTAITCTVGTGTTCNDTTHSAAFANGDLISIQFTTQAGETLAGVKAQVFWQ